MHKRYCEKARDRLDSATAGKRKYSVLFPFQTSTLSLPSAVDLHNVSCHGSWDDVPRRYFCSICGNTNSFVSTTC